MGAWKGVAAIDAACAWHLCGAMEVYVRDSQAAGVSQVYIGEE